MAEIWILCLSVLLLALAVVILLLLSSLRGELGKLRIDLVNVTQYYLPIASTGLPPLKSDDGIVSEVVRSPEDELLRPRRVDDERTHKAIRQPWDG